MNVPVRVSTVRLDQLDRDLGGSHLRSSKYGGSGLSEVEMAIVATINGPIVESLTMTIEPEEMADRDLWIGL
jgi:hypothetical protein